MSILNPKIYTIGGASLSSISITTPPKKTEYMAGDTFDPSGMVVTATLSSGEAIPVHETGVTFSPSGALNETDTQITVSFELGGVIKTAVQNVLVIKKFEWWSPHMTSNTTPAPYVASASSTYDDNYAAWQAFDGIFSVSVNGTGLSGAGTIWLSPFSVGSAWIQFYFGSKKYIDGIRINPHFSGDSSNPLPSSPNRFYLKGSDNGENWTTIQEFADVTWAGIGQSNDFMLDRMACYSYYRIGADNVTPTESNYGVVSYGDIWFHAEAADPVAAS